MENKPFFMDEKEMQALKNAQSEDVIEEKKEIEVETKEEPKDEQKYELTKIKAAKKEKDKLETKKNFKLYVTIICCIVVAYILFIVGRGLYYGFKYYDIAHGDNATTEPQK